MNRKVLGSVLVVNFLVVGASNAMPNDSQAMTEPEMKAESMVSEVKELSRAEKRAIKKAERKARREARKTKRASRTQRRPSYYRFNSFDRFSPYYGYGFRSGFRRGYYGGVSRFGFRRSGFSRFYGGFGFRRGYGYW